MPINTEHMDGGFEEQVNLCFVTPALLPDWFWVPVSQQLEKTGANCTIPELIRDDLNSTVEDQVDRIETTIGQQDLQYLVVLSRGVEYGVRYIDRLAQKRRLHKALGWMVISSVGPRGYAAIGSDNQPLPRKTPEYDSGVGIDANGLETISLECAADLMLHDVSDRVLKNRILRDMIHERPLSQSEIDTVPDLATGILPLAWYIGVNDKVDNIVLSAAIARQQFGVEPTYTTWGHVGPLSHTDQVVNAVLHEVQQAYNVRKQDT